MQLILDCFMWTS